MKVVFATANHAVHAQFLGFKLARLFYYRPGKHYTAWCYHDGYRRPVLRKTTGIEMSILSTRPLIEVEN